MKKRKRQMIVKTSPQDDQDGNINQIMCLIPYFLMDLVKIINEYTLLRFRMRPIM